MCEWPSAAMMAGSGSSGHAAHGPKPIVPEPPETYRSGVENAIELDEMEYLVVTDRLTGAQRIEPGPQLLFPGAYDEVGERQPKVVLRADQYVRVLDSLTGELTVVRGATAWSKWPSW